MSKPVTNKSVKHMYTHINKPMPIIPARPIVVVSGILITNHKNILILYDGNEDMWRTPGCAVEVDESPEQALKRGFLNKCGIHAEILDILDAKLQVDNHNGKIVIYYLVDTQPILKEKETLISRDRPFIRQLVNNGMFTRDNMQVINDCF